MTAHDAGLRTFGQESRDAEAQAGRGYVITEKQARRARRQVAHYCRTHRLGGDAARELIEMLGVGRS